ncbi:adenosylcobinamide-GDP ribazoletransferase [Psychrilyobacter atlanticus]|uniref:adenosylcobinamide-GDP ribazoletransferase n=1 Tax=Psychrilyobacter atlanticus TaxID=271091 RepID=UPI00040F6487|nr:adenosylcobinamide-GDP ribazoletransferase [Psychrilyobacter atlanticus]
MKGFLLLLQFMTRIPTPKMEYEPKKLGKAMKFFPVVGMIIGAILYYSFIVLNQFFDSPEVIAILIILIDIVLTGGLHLDGLADTFDGIFSYRSKKRMLEIMKDSRIGSNGALSLIIYFALKGTLLKEVISVDESPYFLLVMPVIARFNSTLNCGVGKYARPSGMGKHIVEETNMVGVMISFAITAAFSYYFIGMTGIYALLVVSILGIYFAKLMERKIGGITGDTLGAVVEMSTIIVLLVGAING